MLVGEGLVVDASIFEVDLKILGEDIVRSDFVVGAGCAPLFSVAVDVVACLDMTFVLHNRRNTEGIESIGLVACSQIGPISLAMDLF